MKKVTVALAAMAASAGLSSAAVLNLSVASTAGEIITADGVAAPTSTPVLVGTFADLGAIDTSSYAAVLSSFTQFVAATGGDWIAPGFLNANLMLDDSAPPVQGNVPDQLAVVIGDDSPAGFAVVTNAGWVADGFTDPPAPPNTVGMQVGIAANTYIWGEHDPAGGVTNPGAVPGAVVLRPVPEPGAGVLALFATGLLFFRRRR